MPKNEVKVLPKRSSASASPYARKRRHDDDHDESIAGSLDAVTWNSMYERLFDYHKLNGNVDVPIQYFLDPELGVWVQQQRDLYHQGQLPESQFQALEALEFEWQLEEQRYKSKPRGKKPKLAKKFIAEKEETTAEVLEAMKMGTKSTGSSHIEANEAKWNQQYQRLQAYHREHGNLQAIYKHDKSLALWVSQQLRNFRYGQMPQDSTRYKRLEKLEFWTELGPQQQVTAAMPATMASTNQLGNRGAFPGISNQQEATRPTVPTSEQQQHPVGASNKARNQLQQQLRETNLDQSANTTSITSPSNLSVASTLAHQSQVLPQAQAAASANLSNELQEQRQEQQGYINARTEAQGRSQEQHSDVLADISAANAGIPDRLDTTEVGNRNDRNNNEVAQNPGSRCSIS